GSEVDDRDPADPPGSRGVVLRRVNALATVADLGGRALVIERARERLAAAARVADPGRALARVGARSAAAGLADHARIAPTLVGRCRDLAGLLDAAQILASQALAPAAAQTEQQSERQPDRSHRARRSGLADDHGGAGVVVAGRDTVPALGQKRRGPEEQPPRVAGPEVDAAVAAHVAEAGVPKRAVQRIAALEVHHPGDILNGVVAVGRGGAVH